MSESIERETNEFVITFKFSNTHKRQVLAIRSKSAGHHFAEHTRFNLLADDGKILRSEPITQDVAQFIIDHFSERGDTESFNVYEGDLRAGKLLRRTGRDLHPDEIIHKLTREENSFTATGSKLNHHWPVFQKLRETGYGSIIRATMTLHQVCSSRCHYCSTIARNRRDSISLDEAKDFVNQLNGAQAAFNREKFPVYNGQYKQLTGSDIRLRGLILSGGGQPNLWPHFTPFVEWLSEQDLDVGLITNGFPKNIPESIYERFKWIRISITPEDASPHYLEGKFNNQHLPETIKNNPQVTVGYSYVVGAWTDDDILKRIDASMRENGFDYCRMLTDCNLSRGAQLQAHDALSERLRRLGYLDAQGNPVGKFFHQLKYHGTQDEARELWDTGQCMLQTYNVFWDTTGHELSGKSYCYACDSITVLAESGAESKVLSSERRFNHEKWGTVTNDHVTRLYSEPVTPFFDPRSVCSACLFMRNNAAVKQLVSRSDFDDIPPAANLEHVNFP